MVTKLPQVADHDAERAVIGALLVAPDRLRDLEDLQPAVFAAPAHQAIWRAMLAVRKAGLHLDALTIRARLKEPAEVEALRVAEESSLSASNLRSHVAILRTMAMRRSMLQAGAQVIELAGDMLLEPAQLREAFETTLVRTLRDTAERTPARDLVEVLAASLRSMQEQAAGTREPGVLFGLRKLDDRTGGMRRREVTIVAGKTGRGKSSFAWQIAASVALRGHAVLGFTLEMEGEALARRLLAAALEEDSSTLHHRLHVRGQEVLAYSQRLAQAGWVGLHEEPDQTIAEIRSRARVAKTEHPELALVVVDYLQLVLPPPGRYSSREREVAAVSAGLKNLAKELGVAVLALSQFNRELDRENRRPRLSDLRESGAVEHDAALVLLLHDPNPDAAPSNDVPYELLVAKNRHGRGQGIVDLLFRPAWTAFEEWTPPPPEEKPAKGTKAKPAQPSLLERSAGGDG